MVQLCGFWSQEFSHATINHESYPDRLSTYTDTRGGVHVHMHVAETRGSGHTDTQISLGHTGQIDTRPTHDTEPPNHSKPLRLGSST